MSEGFDLVADIYDRIFKPHIRNYYLCKRLKYIVRNFSERKRILDVGCGTGLLACGLQSYGFDVYGLDISQKMIEIASKRLQPGRAFCSNAEKIPFPSEYFDGIICIATLHHISSDRVYHVLCEMSRVLKPQGRLLIWDHNRINPYWFLLMKRVPQDTGSEKIHGAFFLIRMMKKCGIKVIRYERKGFMPDFIPASLVPFFSLLEKGIENLPLLNFLCSHNIIIGEKSSVEK